MRKGRPEKYKLIFTQLEHKTLQQISRSRSEPAGLVRRAQGLLLSSQGHGTDVVAKKLGVCTDTVCYRKKRFIEHGLAGMYDRPKGGRARTYDDERIAGLINMVLRQQPKGASHWSVRSAAAGSGLSKSTVQRYFKLFGLQPHRSKSFTISNDPFFVEKVRDIVGLYLNPPDKALVLSVDEKSQIQALERTQPMLPMGLGYLQGVTHGYYRHGTTTLFAALEVDSGRVITQCKAQHRHQEFLAFLRRIDASVPKHLQLHLIVDNYATHKHPKVRAWFAAHPRYHVHFTPTYSSWLNQVERWFAHITQQAIRRNSFTSVKQLVARIDEFVRHYNLHPKPLSWTASADSILNKLARLTKVISGTGH
jgi:transposase